jgi:hypothetical protein
MLNLKQKGEFIMKIRIINQELSSFNHDYKVKNINYDKVVVEDNGRTIPFSMKDVELIPEGKYEKIILEYKDLLKIKIDTNISPALYAALADYIGNKINNKLENLEVLRDENKPIRKNMWEKRLVVVVNNSIPLHITIIGTKYSNEFSITFKDITLQNFIEGCSEDIRHLRKEIEKKEKDLERHKSILEKVLKNSISSDNTSSAKLVSGS